jgi:hypothetical protein
MQRIHINVGAVRSANVTLSRKAYRVGDTAGHLARLKSGIDPRILARKSIGARLNRAASGLQRLEYRYRKLDSFIVRSMDSYCDADSSVSRKAANLDKVQKGTKDGFWNYFFANTWETAKSSMGGYAMFAAAKNLLKIADGVNFRLFKENERIFIKLVGEAMSRPADYLRYRNLLIEKLGGESGDWKKGYVKRLMDKGIALYDDANEHLNNKAAFRQARNKFSNTNLAPLNQYVKNIGEPWYKVAASGFKDGVIENTKAIFYDDWIGFKGAASNIKASKALGIAGTVIMVGENGYSAYKEGSIKKFAVDTSVDLASGVGSMAAGAAIGSFFLPPVGTVVGAAAGAVINLGLNWKFMDGKKSIVDVTKDFVSNPVDSVKDIGKKLDEIFW